MSRLLFPQSAFVPIVGLELPAIANLSFATFLGNGTINSKDATNIAPGGGAFTLIGQGPSYGLNYGSVQSPSNALQTPMIDTGDAHTIVWVTHAVPSGKFAASMHFETATTVTNLNQLWQSGAPVMRCGSGPLTTSAGTMDIPLVTDTTKWNLLAFVTKGGKPLAGYNLTTGRTVASPTPVVLAARPVAGNWFIGGTSGSYTNPSDVAFALGANTEMSATDLNVLANALRYPLRDREIYV